MRTVSYLLTAITGSIVLTSCSFNDEIEYRIAPELDQIVNEFFEEGQKRGADIEKYNLVVCFDDIHESDHLVGGDAATYGSQRVVRINTRYKDSPLLKYIVFHELGHALLFRSHTEDCNSIMFPELKNSSLSAVQIDELFTIK